MRVLALAACMAFVAGPAVGADDGDPRHIVTPADAQARLAEASRARERALDRLGTALQTPAFEAAAGHLGADVERVLTAATRLDEAELADLAARAEALRSDPVSGANPFVVALAVIGALFLLLLLLAIVSCVATSCD